MCPCGAVCARQHVLSCGAACRQPTGSKALAGNLPSIRASLFSPTRPCPLQPLHARQVRLRAPADGEASLCCSFQLKPFGLSAGCASSRHNQVQPVHAHYGNLQLSQVRHTFLSASLFLPLPAAQALHDTYVRRLMAYGMAGLRWVCGWSWAPALLGGGERLAPLLPSQPLAPFPVPCLFSPAHTPSSLLLSCPQRGGRLAVRHQVRQGVPRVRRQRPHGALWDEFQSRHPNAGLSRLRARVCTWHIDFFACQLTHFPPHFHAQSPHHCRRSTSSRRASGPPTAMMTTAWTALPATWCAAQAWCCAAGLDVAHSRCRPQALAACVLHLLLSHQGS